MRYAFAGLMLTVVLNWAGPALPLTEADVEQTTGPNERYEDSIRFGRIQSEVIYLKPSAPFEPDGDVKIDVPDKPDTEADRERARWTGIIIFGVLLAGVLLVVAYHGNSVAVSFRSTDDKRRGKPAASRQGIAAADVSDLPADGFLDRLRAMADRREALILLVSRALEIAAQKNDVRLGRAQTARDVVRVLPRAWPQISALRRLVREAEIVHFGGRDVAEQTWHECLDLAGPIFAESPAR